MLKSLTYLWQLVLQDCGTRCCTSTVRDLKRVTDRVEHEGLSFLTITLPNFCSDFEKSLDREFVANDLFAGFRFRGGLPEFLQGFLSLVFDHDSGRLLSDPSVDSIFCIRQLCRMFSKIELPCSDARTARAFEGYISVETELKERDARVNATPVFRRESAELQRIFSLLWSDSCTAVDHSIATYGRIRPKHGPGATADGLLGNQKYVQSEWTDRLEAVFPFGEYALPSWKYYLERDSLPGRGRVRFRDPGTERPVKVITVPKTLKTPRIIAVEPTCMQYMQQAIAEMLVEGLESNYSKSFIGFEFQEPNRLMAQKGSSDGSLATLDLSEASDRVSNSLVRRLLVQWPHLAEGVDASRSRKADVNGKTIRLSKFASMGSALTFPLEAMIFASIVFLGIEKSLNRRLTRKTIKSYRGRVRVYGDDIVVPTHCVPQVIRCLEDFGLKVNSDKSFWNGKFRESCGGEYYDGHDVSIVKLKNIFPSSLADAEEIAALESFRNRSYKAGLWGTTRYLDERLTTILRGHFPTVLETSPLLGRHSFLDSYEFTRTSASTHTPLVRGYAVSARIPQNSVENEHALLKYFLKRGLEPFEDRKHLERSGRPRSVDIKARWAPPY